MYSSFAKKLYEANDSQLSSDIIKDLVGKLRTKVPSQDEFRIAFREVIYTNSNSKQKNLVRYILRKFSEYYSYKYPVDFDDLSVEHLYPQSKISGEWPEEVVGCLGNLVFLDQKTNEKLSSKSFEKKKEVIISDGYSWPKFVMDSEDWTQNEIIKHAEEMAGNAYNNIWKI